MKTIDKPVENQSKPEVLGERTYVTLGNHTQIDLHIQVTGDVHTGNWGPCQVNNNESPEIRSRKIEFGNKATYNFQVWKNDNGKPGTFIGDFEHQVRYNAGGNRDHLEFTVVHIDGKPYMRVWSTREAIEVALKIILN